MILGVTGTRAGMTEAQLKVLKSIMSPVPGVPRPILIHGMCSYGGADLQAHDIAFRMGWFIICYPMKGRNPTGIYAIDDSVFIEDEQPPLDRNRTIVAKAETVIAFPKEREEQFRGSGTWATIRYARKRGNLFGIVYPDGTVG